MPGDKPITIDDVFASGVAVKSDPVVKSKGTGGKKATTKFLMGKEESLEQQKTRVQAKLEETYKKKAGKEGGKSSGPASFGPIPWIKDFSPSKVIFDYDGRTYGATWSWDSGEKNVILGSPIEVEQIYSSV